MDKSHLPWKNTIFLPFCRRFPIRYKQQHQFDENSLASLSLSQFFNITLEAIKQVWVTNWHSIERETKPAVVSEIWKDLQSYNEKLFTLTIFIIKCCRVAVTAYAIAVVILIIQFIQQHEKNEPSSESGGRKDARHMLNPVGGGSAATAMMIIIIWFHHYCWIHCHAGDSWRSLIMHIHSFVLDFYLHSFFFTIQHTSLHNITLFIFLPFSFIKFTFEFFCYFFFLFTSLVFVTICLSLSLLF
jgi:hypothetical protein